jgi:hypothetical protein
VKPIAASRRHSSVLTRHDQAARLILGAVAVIVALSASGCGGSSSAVEGHAGPAGLAGSTGAQATAPPSASGAHGVVRGYGGPLVPSPTPHMAIDGAGQSNQEVVASQGGKVVAQTKTDTNGRFALQLSLGSYQLKAQCSGVKHVTVQKTGSVSITLQCDFP